MRSAGDSIGLAHGKIRSCIQGGQVIICVTPNDCGAAGQPCCDVVSTPDGLVGSCDSPNLTCASDGGNLVCR